MKNIIYKQIESNIRTGKLKGRNETERTIHASSITELCPRRECLIKKYNLKTPKGEPIPFGLALTFEIGKCIETVIREKLGTSLLGVWECCNCKELYYGFKPCNCGTCSCDTFNYLEVKLELEKHGFKFTGSMDAIIQLPYSQVSYCGESKSIAPDLFDELTEPRMEHKFQVQTYLWLIKNLSKNWWVKNYGLSSEKGVIIYTKKSKGTFDRNPIKIYEVEIDKQFKSFMRNNLRQLKSFSLTGELPERECLTKKVTTAKNCFVVDRCFNE